MLIYIINQVPGVDFVKIDGDFFQQFLFRIQPVPATFFVALVAIFAGSGLIATDLKNNALSLYLSKPLSWMDYLIGKFAAIGISTRLFNVNPWTVVISCAIAISRHPFSQR